MNNLIDKKVSINMHAINQGMKILSQDEVVTGKVSNERIDIDFDFDFDSIALIMEDTEVACE